MKKVADKEGNAERWLLTYSDLVTLLLIFFIIMYSMSKVDANKYSQLAQALSVTMGGGGKHLIGVDSQSDVKDPQSQVDNVIVPDNSAAEKAEASKLNNLKGQVDTYLQKNGLSGSVDANIQERGLVISITDSLFFDSGSAELNPTFKSKILEIGKMLVGMNNYIVVEGNTDNIPINTSQYKDNWDLAGERANNVTRILISAGVPGDKVSGRANGEYRPVSTNKTDAGRAKNRRVDIVIMDSKYSNSESTKAK